MKRIGLTQRVETIEAYQEKRDAIDQRWYPFLLQCDLLPILIPNDFSAAQNVLENIKLDGFIFSGGNSLFHLKGDAFEREAVEKMLLEYAIEHNMPVLGVCRGMQLIQHYFGVSLQKLKGHVAQNHSILWADQNRQVTSYHEFGTTTTSQDLEIVSRAKDGVIEAVKHRLYRITGIMWHPERCDPFHKEDIELVQNLWAN